LQYISFIYFVKLFSNDFYPLIFQQILGILPHIVPAVYGALVTVYGLCVAKQRPGLAAQSRMQSIRDCAPSAGARARDRSGNPFLPRSGKKDWNG
jgi:hypothetical protein